MSIIKLDKIQDNGDETSNYNIIVPLGLTASQFCEAVVREFPKEWGNIYVNNELMAKFDRGTGKSYDEIYFKYYNSIIISGWANGGWTLMDFHLKVEK